MGKNKSIWFTTENHEFIEKQAEKDKVSFNKKVNQVISEKKKTVKTKKEEV